MNTQQLANVLIKILGLSAIVHSIPGAITGLYNAMRIKGAGGPGEYWFYPVSSLALTVIGILLIANSRAVATLLFRAKDE